MRVSINIPPTFINQPNAYHIIKEICSNYKISNRQIGLELTENAFIDANPKNIDTLNKLKDQGFYLTIDDFGTGYSSLGYIKAFPVDCIKLDNLFVKDIIDSPRDEAIAEAIIQLCNKIGINLIAEGVDTKNKLDKLRELNCKLIQGYYFSTPLSPIDFETHLQAINTKITGNKKAS